MWLQESTKREVLDIVERELITNKAEKIAQSDTGITHFFKFKQFENLKLLFSLFSRQSSTYDEILRILKPYILEKGRKIG